MKTIERLGFLFMMPLFLLGSASLHAQDTVGYVKPYRAQSPHPYPAGNGKRSIVWRQRVASPGAGFVRVHFTGLSLANGDFLTVSALDGSDSETITGKGPYGDGDFWSFRVPGEVAILSVHGGRSPGYGYRIKEVVHGFGPHEKAATNPDVVCGADGREDVVCHVNNLGLYHIQRAVAVLDFNNTDGKAEQCTGWLAETNQPNLLITNHHCISDDKQLKSIVVTFNFIKTTCGGNVTTPRDAYNVEKILGTNEELDYTLLALKKNLKGQNPQDLYGVVVPYTWSGAVSDGEVIYIPQHPSVKVGDQDEAGPTKVAWFEDLDGKNRCTVTAKGSNYIHYTCDTSNGSSGSPVINSRFAMAVALHSGGRNKLFCQYNYAYTMKAICSDGPPGNGKKYLICRN